MIVLGVLLHHTSALTASGTAITSARIDIRTRNIIIVVAETDGGEQQILGLTKQVGLGATGG